MEFFGGSTGTGSDETATNMRIQCAGGREKRSTHSRDSVLRHLIGLSAVVLLLLGFRTHCASSRHLDYLTRRRRACRRQSTVSCHMCQKCRSSRQCISPDMTPYVCWRARHSVRVTGIGDIHTEERERGTPTSKYDEGFTVIHVIDYTARCSTAWEIVCMRT